MLFPSAQTDLRHVSDLWYSDVGPEPERHAWHGYVRAGRLTSVRAMQPGDQEKADQIVTAARSVAEKYKGYKVALADGFKIFLPNLPQKQYHFTNYWNAFEAARHLDPSRPTSLLYEKHGEDYKLIGIMYTARKNTTEDDLNSRIP